MATPKVYDLDQDVQETFRFTLKGYAYDFRQMTTEEIDEFQSKKNDKEIREYLFTFITPVEEKSPKFTEISKQMIAPHWVKFLEMIKTEMAGNGNN